MAIWLPYPVTGEKKLFCTAQACNLRDNESDLRQHGFEVIGVSTDDEKSHQKFINKYQLPFPLIADTNKEIVERYDVWKEKSMYGRKYMGTIRTTFIIDENGIIADIKNFIHPR